MPFTMSSPSSVINQKLSSLGNGYVQSKLERWHKNFLLSLFCLAKFIDAFSNSALFPAIPALQKSLNSLPNELAWMFSAYFASLITFLLILGHVSDIYVYHLSELHFGLCWTCNWCTELFLFSEWTFIVGSAFVGLFSLGCGFAKQKVGMFVLRGLMGMCLGSYDKINCLSVIIP